MIQYPALTHQQIMKLPPMVREVVLAERRMEPFKQSDVLSMSQVRAYKELIDEKNRIVSACNNTYGKVSNGNQDGTRFA